MSVHKSKSLAAVISGRSFEICFFSGAGGASETPLTVNGLKTNDVIFSAQLFFSGIPTASLENLRITAANTILTSTSTVGGIIRLLVARQNERL